MKYWCGKLSLLASKRNWQIADIHLFGDAWRNVSIRIDEEYNMTIDKENGHIIMHNGHDYFLGRSYLVRQNEELFIRMPQQKTLVIVYDCRDHEGK